MKNDLTGRIFGRLSVIGDSGESRKRNRLWLCRCECGKEIKKEAFGLISGGTRSCGCLQRELASNARIVDHTGRRFGMLTVIAMDSAGRGYGAAYAHWLCRCDCGGEKVVRSGALVSGETVSCGCAKAGSRAVHVRAQSVVRAARRRALKLSVGGGFTAAQIVLLYRAQRGRCANCRARLIDGFHRDHRKALSNGGSNDISNIELLCQLCNTRKHAKDEIAWANENGRLL